MRRGFRILGKTALVAVAAALVGAVVGLLLVFLPAHRSGGAVPFYGQHQSGILTPAQSYGFVASFDLTTTDVGELRSLMRIWTDAADRMTRAQPVGPAQRTADAPPTDTGEAESLAASHLTVTFGAGPSLFDGRFGLAALRPPALVGIPPMPGDRLRPEWSGGDLGVQICADDAQVAFHALRELIRTARGTAAPRWIMSGFRPAESGPTRGTSRNLQGFKDGTANPDPGDGRLMQSTVWAQPGDGPRWMDGGSYLVVRRIRMLLEVWDRSSLEDQQRTIGRAKGSGAPLGRGREKDPLDLAASSGGEPLIPETAHVRLAHGDGSEVLLRRGYSYAAGVDAVTGQLDAGLLFLAFQRDPRAQFIPIQQRLAASDALNEYVATVGSAVFACFPGASPGGYVGQALLEGKE